MSLIPVWLTTLDHWLKKKRVWTQQELSPYFLSMCVFLLLLPLIFLRCILMVPKYLMGNPEANHQKEESNRSGARAVASWLLLEEFWSFVGGFGWRRLTCDSKPNTTSAHPWKPEVLQSLKWLHPNNEALTIFIVFQALFSQYFRILKRDSVVIEHIHMLDLKPCHHLLTDQISQRYTWAKKP